MNTYVSSRKPTGCQVIGESCQVNVYTYLIHEKLRNFTEKMHKNVIKETKLLAYCIASYFAKSLVNAKYLTNDV